MFAKITKDCEFLIYDNFSKAVDDDLINLFQNLTVRANDAKV
jgi:hypothetical protein